jgi:Tfp pilus assembly protein PilO
MNKLSKEKRDKLILVCIAGVAVAGVLYTFVLGSQKNKLGAIQSQITGAQAKLAKAESALKAADVIEAQLAENKRLIDIKQENMAPQGQYYYWFFRFVDQFRKDEKLDSGFIVDITHPEFIEAGMLPKFPYKAASFGLRVNGEFRDVGRFIANLENAYPYFRVQNIRLAPAPHNSKPAPVTIGSLTSPLESLEPETKLIAELKVVTLIKPGSI